MTELLLGKVTAFNHSRYVITLSTDKRLVLFRLPEVPGQTTKKSSGIHDGWQYFCMESQCPHAGGPMSDSDVTFDIEDNSYIASCPWHAYDFNLETGDSSYGMKACTYPVHIVNENLYILINHTDDSVALINVSPVSERIKLKPPKSSNTKTTTSTHADQVQIENEGIKPEAPSSDATVCEWCAHILCTSDPERKIELTDQLFRLFVERQRNGNPMAIGSGKARPPDQPPRENMTEVNPWQTQNLRRGGSVKSRISMLHALANIEQWAIDLALDICVRFADFRCEVTNEPLPLTFYHDWLKVANDEAKHFSLLRARLEELGSYFGALPVHHGLWESAKITAHDLRARISVIALVHEARGLDVNPMTIEKFRKGGDLESVDCLTIIHNDEITHVTTGHRWLSWICQQEGTDPVQVFRQNVQNHFKGSVKGPFNAEARSQAGLDKSYYEDLNGQPWKGHVLAGG